MRNRFITSLCAIGFLFVLSCEKTVDERSIDEMLRFNAYMQVHYPDLKPTESGLFYIISRSENQGDRPTEGDYILYDYTIQDLDDNVIETTNRHNAWLNDILSKTTNYAPALIMYINPLKPLMKGLEEGLGMMGPGDTARFFMPSSLAFGASKYKDLQAYSSVICDIILHRVIPEPEEYERELIANYLAANHPNISINDTVEGGIYILELEEGLGEEYFVDNDEVSVNYSGILTDGFMFDTNIQEVAVERGIYNAQKSYTPFSFTVGGTGAIVGFSVMARQLKPEGKAKVLIPSSRAYGTEGSTNIAPYAPLIFEVTVLTEYVEPEEEEAES